MERWIRNHDQLDSKNGIVRFDVDILLHRFKTFQDNKGVRDIEFMMFIEVKTFNADLTLSQRDTLGILNQFLRNRCQNMHSEPRRQITGQPPKVYSRAKQKEIPIRMLGGHLLQLSGSNPDDGDCMYWDYRQIDKEMLVDLMLFNRDPDNLSVAKKDWMRRRSAAFAKIKNQQGELFNSDLP